jgi:hypothetical protein
MQFRLGAKWTNRLPTLKEASGNHGAQSRRRSGSVHHQGFVPDVSGLTNGLKNTGSAIELKLTARTCSSACPCSGDTHSTCDLLGEERAERDARDPPNNFADQDSDAAVGSCVWPAPGVHKAHIELAGGRSRSPMSLIIPDDRQPFYPDLRERIKVGDELLVVAPEDQGGKIEDRLRDVASVVGSPAHATYEE